jgi:hypothetical protein
MQRRPCVVSRGGRVRCCAASHGSGAALQKEEAMENDSKALARKAADLNERIRAFNDDRGASRVPRRACAFPQSAVPAPAALEYVCGTFRLSTDSLVCPRILAVAGLARKTHARSRPIYARGGLASCPLRADAHVPLSHIRLSLNETHSHGHSAHASPHTLADLSLDSARPDRLAQCASARLPARPPARVSTAEYAGYRRGEGRAARAP